MSRKNKAEFAAVKPALAADVQNRRNDRAIGPASDVPPGKNRAAPMSVAVAAAPRRGSIICGDAVLEKQAQPLTEI